MPKTNHNYGNKAKNLINTMEIIGKDNVPAIFPISHENIIKILEACGYDIAQEWQSINESTTNDKIEKILSNIIKTIKQITAKKEFKAELEKVCFNDDKNKLQQWLINLKEEQIIARSSSNEDEKDNANPGGNESIPFIQPNSKDLAKAIGEVIASYFSYKSITQRMQIEGRKAVFSKLPLCSVLLQQMIYSNQKTLVSGVTYTKEPEGNTPNLYITEATFGNGEGVVGNKAPLDTYICDNKTLKIDSSIANKTFRLGRDSSNKLVYIDNITKEYQPKKRAISPNMLQGLIKLCSIIANKYNNVSLDVEWVILEDKIYIVQVRNTPSLSKEIDPSYVANAKKSDIISNGKPIVIGSGQPLELKENNIITANTLEEAHKIFLGSNNEELKVVFAKDKVNPTSHFAGYFRQIGVSVVKVTNIQVIVDAVKNSRLTLDIQRGNLLKGSLLKYKIKEGFIRHPASISLSLGPVKFSKEQADYIKKEFSNENITKETDGNKKSTHKINANIINILDELSANSSKDDLQKLKYLFRSVTTYIEKLIKSTNNKSLRDELKIVYQNFLSTLHDIHKIIKAEFNPKNTNLSNQNMQKLYALDKIRTILFQNIDPNYLNTFSLKTIISHINTETKYEKILANKQGNKKTTDKNTTIKKYFISKKSKLDTANTNNTDNSITKNYALQLLQIEKLFMSDSKKQQWINFIRDLYNENLLFAVKQLSKFVVNLKKINYFGSILNQYFTYEVKNNYKDKLMEIKKVFQNIRKIHKYVNTAVINNKELSITINIWENKIPDWSNPYNFEKNFKDLKEKFDNHLQKSIQNINKISEEKNSSIMNNIIPNITTSYLQEAIEIYDKTIKQITSSSLYRQQETQLKLQRFSKLFSLYLDLFKSLAKAYVNLYPKEKQDLIVSMEKGKYNAECSFDNYIKAISSNHEFNNKLIKSGENLNRLLQPSPSLSINSCIFGAATDYRRSGLTTNPSNKKFITLESLFSLVHQNLEILTALFENKFNNLQKELPKDLSEFVNNIVKKQHKAKISFVNYSYPLIKIKINVPLRQHSNQITVTYNTTNKDINIKFSTFSVDEANRHEAFVVAARSIILLYGDLIKVTDWPFAMEDIGLCQEISFGFSYKFGNNKTLDKNIIEKYLPLLNKVGFNGYTNAANILREIAKNVQNKNNLTLPDGFFAQCKTHIMPLLIKNKDNFDNIIKILELYLKEIKIKDIRSMKDADAINQYIDSSYLPKDLGSKIFDDEVGYFGGLDDYYIGNFLAYKINTLKKLEEKSEYINKICKSQLNNYPDVIATMAVKLGSQEIVLILKNTTNSNHAYQILTNLSAHIKEIEKKDNFNIILQELFHLTKKISLQTINNNREEGKNYYISPGFNLRTALIKNIRSDKNKKTCMHYLKILFELCLHSYFVKGVDICLKQKIIDVLDINNMIKELSIDKQSGTSYTIKKKRNMYNSNLYLFSKTKTKVIEELRNIKSQVNISDTNRFSTKPK